MIKNGLIELNNIYGVPFTQDLIPKSNTIARPAYVMIPEYLTVHNTGNRKRTANAEMHTEYVDTATGYVSWHFTVDDKQIIQELPINENSWNAGDGRNGTGNRKSISIEICEHEGIDWNKAKENAVKLIVFLIRNVPTLKTNPVKPHQFWNGKYCPHKILDEGWDKLINQINQYNTLTNEINSIESACYFLKGKAFSDAEGWIKKANADSKLAEVFIVMAKNWDTLKKTQYMDTIFQNVIKSLKVG